MFDSGMRLFEQYVEAHDGKAIDVFSFEFMSVVRWDCDRLFVVNPFYIVLIVVRERERSDKILVLYFNIDCNER